MRRLFPLALVLALACGRRALVPASSDTAPANVARDGAAPPEVAPGSDALPHGNPARLPDGGCVEGAFVVGGACACDPADPDVCNERCTDTNRDPDNCGACGRGCAPTAACNAGSCGSAPVVYQPPPPTGCKSLHLAIDGSSLYWTDEASGTVMRAPTTGGAPVPIAVGEDRPTWLAVRGARVFWVTGGPGSNPSGVPTLGRSIRVGSQAGGDPKTIADVGNLYGSVVADDGATVYYSTDGEIEKISSSGGPSSLVATGVASRVRGLAISGTTLIALDNDYGQVVVIDLAGTEPADCLPSRAPTTGDSTGPCRQFESSLGHLLTDTVSVRGNLVYWADAEQIRSYDVSSTNASWMVVTMADAPFVNALCLGGDRSFFASDDAPLDSPGPDTSPPSAGLIEMAALDPGSPSVVLARSQRRPQSIASDGNRVFWSTGDCAIWSVAP